MKKVHIPTGEPAGSEQVLAGGERCIGGVKRGLEGGKITLAVRTDADLGSQEGDGKDCC